MEKICIQQIILEHVLQRFLFVPGKFFQCKTQWNLYLYVAAPVVAILLVCYVAIILTSNNNSGNPTDPHKPLFIYREEWGGRLPRRVEQLDGPVPIVVIRDTRKTFCIEKSDCLEDTQKIQNDNMSNNLNDIAYNFLIGGDGNIYVGRGWDVKSAFSNRSVDIAFHGNYEYDHPYPDMIQAASILIKQGVKMHYVTRNYSVVCQNQTERNGRAARHLCGEVRTWKHFDNRTYYDDFPWIFDVSSDYLLIWGFSKILLIFI